MHGPLLQLAAIILVCGGVLVKYGTGSALICAGILLFCVGVQVEREHVRKAKRVERGG